MSLEREVFDTLKTDAEHRYSGVKDDWFKLSDIESSKDWDYSLPTLVHQTSERDCHVRTMSHLKDFQLDYYKKHPFMKIVFDYDNPDVRLVVAGGSVGDFLVKNNRSQKNDIDMFLIFNRHMDVTEATGVLREITRHIISSYKRNILKQQKEKERTDTDNSYNSKKAVSKKTKKSTDDIKIDFSMYRNNNCLSINLPNDTVQIIFRMYTSISELLHGFDLGSSAVAFDGNEVYLTSLSKFAYQYGCNIVDTMRRSTTYEMRLKKYFERGFDIILPYLDISKLRTNYLKYDYREVCELPHFKISYDKIYENRITVFEFLSKYADRSDYSDEFDVGDIYPMYHYNMGMLLHTSADKLNNCNFYYYSESTDLDKLEIFDMLPLISANFVEKYYETVHKRLDSNKTLQLKEYKSRITVMPFNEYLKKRFFDGVDKQSLNNEVIKKQKEYVIGILDIIKSRNIPWIIENPGTQLTSSINPIIAEPKDWYGEYFCGALWQE